MAVVGVAGVSAFLVVHFHRRRAPDEEGVERASDMGLNISRVRSGCSM